MMKYHTKVTRLFENLHLPAIFVVILVSILLTAKNPAEANWPGFRGPTGLGYTTEENLPIVWGGPENENVLWTSPLTGQGHASPIAWDNSVIICTVNWPADVEDRKKVIPEHHVSCYRTSDGKMLWDTLVPPGPWLRTDFRSGPGGGYAAATPVTDGRLFLVGMKNIYCIGNEKTGTTQ